MKNCGITLIRGKNETSGRQSLLFTSRSLYIMITQILQGALDEHSGNTCGPRPRRVDAKRTPSYSSDLPFLGFIISMSTFFIGQIALSTFLLILDLFQIYFRTY